MSRYRKGAGGKRDENEPAIIKALRAHGCVVWQLSGKGIPDLLVLHRKGRWLADVKMPGKPTTKPQEDAWDEAATKARCAVFILRSPEDAVAMLNNALAPWGPDRHERVPGGLKKLRIERKDHLDAALPADAATEIDSLLAYALNKPLAGLGQEVMREMLKPEGKEDYNGALKRALAAAKEAEETFAPVPCLMCAAIGRQCGACSP